MVTRKVLVSRLCRRSIVHSERKRKANSGVRFWRRSLTLKWKRKYAIRTETRAVWDDLLIPLPNGETLPVVLMYFVVKLFCEKRKPRRERTRRMTINHWWKQGQQLCSRVLGVLYLIFYVTLALYRETVTCFFCHLMQIREAQLAKARAPDTFYTPNHFNTARLH